MINLDFLGPFSNGQCVFVTIDQRTKYPEVKLVTSTFAKNVFFALERFLVRIYRIR